MPYQITLPGLSNARGTHYTQGSDFLYFLRSNNSTSDGIYRVPIQQAVLLAESYGVTVAPPATGKAFNLNNFTGSDLQWVTGPNRLRTQLSSRILPIPGATSLDSITPEQLVALNWSSVTNNNSVTEPGTSTTGNFYAVRIPVGSDFNYAKIRVYNDGVTRLDWATYLISPNPVRVSALGGQWSDIVVSEYETSIFVSGIDALGNHCVVQLERTTSGPYPQYDGALASQINSRSLSNPRQMVLDGGFVYVVDDSALWRIEAGTGDQVQLVTGLVGGVGLLLRTSGTSLLAYISDAAGDIRVVNLSEYNENTGVPLEAPAPVYSIGGPSGFMTWVSAERTALYVTEQGSGRVIRLDLDDGMMTDEVTGLSTPWSVEVMSPVEMYVCSDREIGINRKVITVTEALLLGIGLVPFDYINSAYDDDLIRGVLAQTPAGANDGRANTSVAPGYYFSQTPNIPFGGNLSLQINHEEAWEAGLFYFRVSIHNVSGTSRVITGGYVNMLWDGTRFNPVTTTPTNSRYPVRDPDDLWYNHFLGVVIPTTTADNGHNVLRVEFFNTADASELPSVVQERLILVDNTRYNTSLQLIRVGLGGAAPVPGVYPTLDCGCIGYDTKDAQIAVDFSASHPQGVGRYWLRFYRGNLHLADVTEDGDVTLSPTNLVKNTVGANPLRIGHLTGDCDIAGIQVHLSATSRVIDGYGWVDLGSYSYRSFTLAPLSAMLNTPWP